MRANNENQNDLITIGELSKKTGVNSVTLRAWERRYGLLKPTRTPKGHRLYSQSDIEYVMTVLAWLNKGIAVSKVKPLMDTNTIYTNERDENNDAWEQYIQEFHKSSLDYNEQKVDAVFNKLNKQYPFETLMKFCFTSIFESFDNSPDVDSTHYFLCKCLKQRLVLMLLRLSKANNKKATSSPMIVLFSLTQDSLWKIWSAAIWLADKGFIVHVFDDIKTIEIANQLTNKLKPTVSLCFSQGNHKTITQDAILNYQGIDFLTGSDFWLKKSELLNQQSRLQIFYQPIDVAYEIFIKYQTQLENN